MENAPFLLLCDQKNIFYRILMEKQTKLQKKIVSPLAWGIWALPVL